MNSAGDFESVWIDSSAADLMQWSLKLALNENGWVWSVSVVDGNTLSQMEAWGNSFKLKLSWYQQTYILG